ncbi:DUF1573 domain-containing protein [Niastella caeni]|uniref:DUF1573 domain-containing protein n=1 Tax=Niastella caeni TaxID=2569763 RepID=A0A4S8HJH5_9BACT|nr:DUF1573 domain-containing protein [Niastella caeni]THU34751.1 DUF1573 domain-containing protein [Niastella caeni]
MKTLFVLPVFFLLIASCRHSGIHYENGTIEEVFARALKENKKVFVLISNSDCGQCDLFKKKLGTETATARILAADYLCYYADVLDSGQKNIAQIVKCPSYPFPYFFDKNGNLEAFGFPNSKDYDISDLSRIGIDEYKFRELFRLPVTTTAYKQLVSHNLQAYLLMHQGQSDPRLIDSAYRLAAASMDIAIYPYNIYMVHTLGKRVTHPSLPQHPILAHPPYTKSDQLIYGKLLEGIPFSSLLADSLLPTTKAVNGITYAFEKDIRECGDIPLGTDYDFRFLFKNTGTKELIIANAEHSCSCIELQWPKRPIAPGQTGFITGVFHAGEKGKFKKEIYVHTPSPQVPMKIITLTGVVR